jgi:hypothetical protein
LSDELSDLNAILEEARLLGVEYERLRRSFMVDLGLLKLPSSEGETRELSVQLRLWPVGRVLATLTDAVGRPVSLTLGELPSELASFGGLALYGGEFFDAPLSAKALSEPQLDVELIDSPSMHSIYLFQLNAHKDLDVWVWFDHLEFRDMDGRLLEPRWLVAEAKRWWDAVAMGDPRTARAGIYPIK